MKLNALQHLIMISDFLPWGLNILNTSLTWQISEKICALNCSLSQNPMHEAEPSQLVINFSSFSSWYTIRLIVILSHKANCHYFFLSSSVPRLLMEGEGLLSVVLILFQSDTSSVPVLQSWGFHRGLPIPQRAHDGTQKISYPMEIPELEICFCCFIGLFLFPLISSKSSSVSEKNRICWPYPSGFMPLFHNRGRHGGGVGFPLTAAAVAAFT